MSNRVIICLCLTSLFAFVTSQGYYASYIDQICMTEGLCRFALIAGKDAGQMWSHYRAVNVTENEIKTIVHKLRLNANDFKHTGVRLGGDTYRCLTIEDGEIHAQKEHSFLIVKETRKLFIAAVGMDRDYNALIGKVRRVADYFQDSGY